MLKIENLRKKYKSGPLALKKVNLNVSNGEIVALIGPSGAGKSTLVRCINQLVKPTSGKIWFEGEEITDYNYIQLRELRKNIGMIFQEHALIERLSVMENVLSGRLGYVGFWQSAFRKFSKEDIFRAVTLLERVGLEDYVDTRADELSGGQRQRVGIARALVQQPKLLLIDEPTASLDPKTSRTIMRLIVELVKEKEISAIVNIHQVDLAVMFAQRIIGLREGEIVYDTNKNKGGLEDNKLDSKVMTLIFGDEDWERKKDNTLDIKKQKHDQIDRNTNISHA